MICSFAEYLLVPIFRLRPWGLKVSLASALLLTGAAARADTTTTKTTTTTSVDKDGDGDADEVDKEETTVTRRHGRGHHGDWIIEDRSHHDRPNQFDLSLGFDGWVGGGNLAGWYTIPIVDDGFIRSINDSFDIEFGAIASIFYNYGVFSNTLYALSPLVGVRWNFYLTPQWVVFANVKLGADIYLDNDNTGASSGFAGFGGVGATYMLNEQVLLRLDSNNYQLIAVGLAFNL